MTYQEKMPGTVASAADGDYTDELRVKGVRCRGYGILPKIVMNDPDLTIESKAIYAYFASFTGHGNTAFPSRARIFKDLSVGKMAYYTHFRLLTDQGYITVEQPPASERADKRFRKNIYTIEGTPMKYLQREREDPAAAAVCRGGLESGGYGLIPKLVMEDPDIPLISKGLYAVLCAMAGTEESVYPDMDGLSARIGISRQTITKYIRPLSQKGYVRSEQARIGGRLRGSLFTIIRKPHAEIERRSGTESRQAEKRQTIKQDTAEQDTIKQDTIKQDTIKQDTAKQDTAKQDTANLPVSETPRAAENPQYIRENVGFSHFDEAIEEKNTVRFTAGGNDETELLHTMNQDTVKQDTAKRDTNINNTNTNNINNTERKKERKKDAGARVREEADDILPAGLPAGELADRVKRLCAWNLFSSTDAYANDKTGYNRKVYMLFVSELTQMLLHGMKTDDGFVAAGEVYDKLRPHVKEGFLGCNICEIMQTATDGYKKGAAISAIRNPRRYMRGCIWNTLMDGAIRWNHDFLERNA